MDRLLPRSASALGLAGTLVVGMVVEVVALRALYDRDHLDQVLATFGLILFFNELVAMIWGRAALYASLPAWLPGHIELFTGSTLSGVPRWRSSSSACSWQCCSGTW